MERFLRRAPKDAPDIVKEQTSKPPSRSIVLRFAAGIALTLNALGACSALENKRSTESAFMDYVAKYRPDLLDEMKSKGMGDSVNGEPEQNGGSGTERQPSGQDNFANFIQDRELSADKIKALLDNPSASIAMADMVDLGDSVIGPSNHDWYSLADKFPGYFGYKSFVCDNERYAEGQSIRALFTVISYWHVLHGNNEIRLGELTAAGHDSHRKGTSIDLNTYGDGVVNTGEPVAGNKLVPNYSKERTIELAKLFAKLVDEQGRPMVKLIYFGTNFRNNEDIYKQVLRVDGTVVVLPWSGHDDHMHIEFYSYSDSEDYSGAVFAPQC